MERKKTQIEIALIEKGYHLDSKTYKGKNSKVVNNYIYIKDLYNIKYYVYLDNKRLIVDHIAFTTKTIDTFDTFSIEQLQKINDDFNREIHEIVCPVESNISGVDHE